MPRVEVYTPEVLAMIEKKGRDFAMPGGELTRQVAGSAYAEVFVAGCRLGE